MKDYQNEFIQAALKYEALQFGDFTLKSGRKSNYFFNLGHFSSGAALSLLGLCYARTIVDSKIEFDMLFGPAYKGIPLVSAASIHLAEQFGRDIPYCYNRKEAKDHGEGGFIVGAKPKGRVLILDDVITAGTAIREAINLIKEAGAETAGVVIAFDRQEPGLGELSAVEELHAEHGFPVTSIIRKQDLPAENDSIKSAQA